MKLSQNTLNLLRNFSTINANIFVKKGNKLSTMAVERNIMAEVEIGETFPNDFGIFNLNEFLGVLSLMNEPDLTFGAKEVLIKEAASKIHYTYAAPDILVYPTKDINMPPVDVEFTLTAANLDQLQKAARALSLQDIAFVGDGKTIAAQIVDKKSESANSYEIALDIPTKLKFSAFFRIERLKMLPDDYKVALSSKKISRFVGNSNKVTYYVALEDDSVF